MYVAGIKLAVGVTDSQSVTVSLSVTAPTQSERCSHTYQVTASLLLQCVKRYTLPPVYGQSGQNPLGQNPLHL